MMSRLALALAFFLVVNAGTTQARMLKERAPHLLGKRQGIVVGTGSQTQPINTNEFTPVAPSSAATNPQQGGGLVSSLIGGVVGPPTPVSSSTPVAVTTPSVTSASPPSSTSISTEESSSAVTARSSSRPATSVVPSIVEITSTQSVESASSSASMAAQNEEDSGEMGVGKKTIIIVASVAGSVGLLIAIWTILRKTKFSPSRRFERRLNPIDWTPADLDPSNPNQTPPTTHAAAMARAGSDDSISLKRGNSWGSQAGSQRGHGMMSEVGYGSRNNVTYNAAPAYPPGMTRPTYSPPYPATNNSSTYTLANPYEQVTRQASQTHGGRYGEGYNY